ncbi:uncharacterized protein PGTG_19709 [Puccinia graminis f. sp. tritici CRL 75-36-700-3]|uniref:Uncharacterized protein n=1 Tax=Puccinia graminis f. sp. tritici (strain CRL 75-36-700-3 / race SCCL) TaxID=418459 RepID=E3LB00_PUCGT|nr:uncharacterized protein PGTG_19709 [Puccinia graminis f. sp. tritici CRL 75-36-700-3]EFP93725.1 hypothetical protein PGTG_19709 [Puccinia graminis f. sp. tritici CRL 75-36-700-3]
MVLTIAWGMIGMRLGVPAAYKVSNLTGATKQEFNLTGCVWNSDTGKVAVFESVRSGKVPKTEASPGCSQHGDAPSLATPRGCHPGADRWDGGLLMRTGGSVLCYTEINRDSLTIDVNSPARDTPRFRPAPNLLNLSEFLFYGQYHHNLHHGLGGAPGATCPHGMPILLSLGQWSNQLVQAFPQSYFYPTLAVWLFLVGSCGSSDARNTNALSSTISSNPLSLPSRCLDLDPPTTPSTRRTPSAESPIESPLNLDLEHLSNPSAKEFFLRNINNDVTQDVPLLIEDRFEQLKRRLGDAYNTTQLVHNKLESIIEPEYKDSPPHLQYNNPFLNTQAEQFIDQPPLEPENFFQPAVPRTTAPVTNREQVKKPFMAEVEEKPTEKSDSPQWLKDFPFIDHGEVSIEVRNQLWKGIPKTSEWTTFSGELPYNHELWLQNIEVFIQDYQMTDDMIG